MNTALHETVRGGVVTKAIQQVIKRLSVLQKDAFFLIYPTLCPELKKFAAFTFAGAETAS